MSTAVQQTTYTTGGTVTAAILNAEIGNIITHLNSIYDFIDDTTGSAILTVDTTSNYLGLGTDSPNTGIHISTAGISGLAAGDPVILVEGTANNERIHLKTYGSATNIPSFQGLTARGTVASPTATQSGDVLVQLRGDGVDNAAAETGSQGRIQVLAAENFTTTAQGTKALLKLTPLTTTTETDALEVKIGTAGNTTLTASNGDLAFDVAANGDLVRFVKHPRDNKGSATYVDSHIQSGWGYIQGDSTGNITTTVTFPVAYNTDNVRVIVSSAGYRSSVPSNEGDLNTNSGIMVASTEDVTSTNFKVNLTTTGIFSTSNYHGFFWIAIGPTA